ncbi:MAG: hypothetical protein JKY43_03200 [Phycisphaerales bacterium]|nr:hypothetical protein [Phycisphaerales bacterium]
MKNFQTIPGFSKYEFNGEICRSIKTKKPKAKKAKNGKYQLVSDEGKNIDRSPEELIDLMPKKEKPMFSKLGKSKSVMFMVNLLHHQGKTKDEICSELNISSKKYTDCKWHYDKKNYKAKIEKYLAK